MKTLLEQEQKHSAMAMQATLCVAIEYENTTKLLSFNLKLDPLIK